MTPEAPLMHLPFAQKGVTTDDCEAPACSRGGEGMDAP